MRRGFTLVELLVAVSIIGCLMGLLLPAVLAAREVARRAQCSSNLHQAGVSITQETDRRGRLPHFLFTAPFRRNPEKLRCPDAVDRYGNDRDMFDDQGHYLQLHVGITREAAMEISQLDSVSCPLISERLLLPDNSLPHGRCLTLYLDGHVH